MDNKEKGGKMKICKEIVMRYSGPRIMLYHPLVGTIHGIETIKGVIKAKKKSK